MPKKSDREEVGLPQPNPGNVAIALAEIRKARPGKQISKEWLEDQGISQPNQVGSLLQMLRLVDENDRIADWVSELRTDAEEFREELRDCAVAAYADAGCGSRQSLGWIGRDALTNEEIKDRIKQRGPLAGKALTRGGSKNAFYCLHQLHAMLLNPEWLLQPTEDTPDLSTESRPTRNASAGGHEADPMEDPRLLQGRFRDPQALHEFLVGLLDSQTAGARNDDKSSIQVVFWRGSRGDRVTAEIRFDAALEPGDYASLGRVLQKMGEAVEEETT